MHRKLFFLLVLVAVVLILAYRARGWEFDWSSFAASFRNVQVGWLAASVVATLATYIIRAFRWRVLLSHVKSIRIEPVISATLVGFSAIYILGRAGEVIRPIWLTRREQVPLSASVATILVERSLDFLMLIGLFAWTVLAVEIPAAANAGTALAAMKKGAWVLVVFSAGAMVCMYIFRSNVDRIVSRVRFARVASLLHEFGQGLSFLERGRSFGMALLYSVTLWIVISLQFWFMILGVRLDFNFSAAALVLVVTAIASIVQVPGIGGGFQLGFSACMTTFFAVPAERAVAASLVAWALSYVPTIAISAVYMLFTGLSFKDLRVQTASD
jgi:uncharacterized protein (TIRG00374 family)